MSQQEHDDPRPLGIALHEAAHTFGAIKMGVGIAAVEAGLREGRTVFQQPGKSFTQAVVLLMGAAAQGRHSGFGAAYHYAGDAGSDVEKARGLVNDHDFRLAEGVAKRIVDRHWITIEHLADVLSRRGSLTEAQASAIVRAYGSDNLVSPPPPPVLSSQAHLKVLAASRRDREAGRPSAAVALTERLIADAERERRPV